MGTNSKIQWTDHSVNFWTGCKKVSSGCKFCYMYRDKERYKLDPTDVVRVSEKTIKGTLYHARKGDKIFTCSWSDFFISEADQWRDDAWQTIRENPHLNWQILTKRPERVLDNLTFDWGNGWPQVWIGVSIENHDEIENRLHWLAEIKHKSPNCITFVSAEPLIGWTDFRGDSVLQSHNFDTCIDWVIIGGESGNNTGKYRYRPCEIDWIEHIVRDAHDAGIPVFVKQLGTHLAKVYNLKDRHGGDLDEWPDSLEHIKERRFPVRKF